MGRWLLRKRRGDTKGTSATWAPPACPQKRTGWLGDVPIQGGRKWRWRRKGPRWREPVLGPLLDDLLSHRLGWMCQDRCRNPDGVPLEQEAPWENPHIVVVEEEDAVFDHVRDSRSPRSANQSETLCMCTTPCCYWRCLRWITLNCVPLALRVLSGGITSAGIFSFISPNRSRPSIKFLGRFSTCFGLNRLENLRAPASLHCLRSVPGEEGTGGLWAVPGPCVLRSSVMGYHVAAPISEPSNLL